MLTKELNLEEIIKDASDFIIDEFNFRIDRTKLMFYNSNYINNFFPEDAFEVYGFYRVKDLIAYINLDKPYIIPTIFHEYFGHGLFIEHSILGNKLLDYARTNNKLELEKLLYDFDLAKTQMFGLCYPNLCNYEGFALWMEDFLSRGLNKYSIFEGKLKTLGSLNKEMLSFFKEFEERSTPFGVIAQLGFPKYYDNNKLLKLLRSLYNEKFSSIIFIILYGSKKPLSDIDLFIVSYNSSRIVFNGWLDIFEVNYSEFVDSIYHFDISMTDPLFSGDVIYGDSELINRIKEQLIKKPIDKEDILYNLAESKKQEDLSKLYKFNHIMKQRGLFYSRSFYLNALELRKGRKQFTLVDLQGIYGKNLKKQP